MSLRHSSPQNNNSMRYKYCLLLNLVRNRSADTDEKKNVLRITTSFTLQTPAMGAGPHIL